MVRYSQILHITCRKAIRLEVFPDAAALRLTRRYSAH